MKEIEGIYAGYEAYYQSGGDEQVVFDHVTGTPRRRSDVILEHLTADRAIKDTGHALDVGCGNGVTLAAMSAALPGWSFSGYELDAAVLVCLSDIPRFVKLYTGALDVIEGSFDFVTLIHSLEHFPFPMEALTQLLSIVGSGSLFIEVCNVDENPFDILVADHLIHFNPFSLQLMLKRAGYGTSLITTQWVLKEISLLASTDGNVSGNLVGCVQGEEVFHRISSYVSWLKTMMDETKEFLCKKRPLGIFGTSVAATWLASQLEEDVSFFVDEDESRIGKKHMGRPILHPTHIPPGGSVYLALAPNVARVMATRLENLPCLFIPPPLLRVN